MLLGVLLGFLGVDRCETYVGHLPVSLINPADSIIV